MDLSSLCVVLATPSAALAYPTGKVFALTNSTRWRQVDGALGASELMVPATAMVHSYHMVLSGVVVRSYLMALSLVLTRSCFLVLS